jgi:hypothetical protein
LNARIANPNANPIASSESAEGSGTELAFNVVPVIGASRSKLLP